MSGSLQRKNTANAIAGVGFGTPAEKYVYEKLPPLPTMHAGYIQRWNVFPTARRQACITSLIWSLTSKQVLVFLNEVGPLSHPHMKY